MRLHKSPRSIIEQAYNAALESNTNKEDDREFRDFIESVSVSKEQLAAIVSTATSSSVLVFEALAVGGCAILRRRYNLRLEQTAQFLDAAHCHLQ